jgi:hypothetical protein
MKAETGKFESKLQQDQPKQIPAGDVVIGVVQMHNAMVMTIKALQASNHLLMQLEAAVDPKTGQLRTTVALVALQEMIKTNNEALGQVELTNGA